MDCPAWAFLPNHFHLLLRTHPIPLSLIMRRLMTAYAGHFNWRHHQSAHKFIPSLS
jgi:putative transposase